VKFVPIFCWTASQACRREDGFWLRQNPSSRVFSDASQRLRSSLPISEQAAPPRKELYEISSYQLQIF